MYPKPLLDQCIDAIVRRTMYIKHNIQDEKAMHTIVKQLWDDLWQLPLRIPRYASELLHANLSHFLAQDVTTNFLILLAANSRRIIFMPDKRRQLVTLTGSSLFEQCNVYGTEYHLHELDITGVDLGDHLDVLKLLLPKCVHLCVLKLGGNTTDDVLLAARACPIRVLHINERHAWKNRVRPAVLMKIFFGETKLVSTDILANMIVGEPPDLNPTWPNLIDLSTGYCRVHCDFVVLALITFQSLRYISSSLVSSAYYISKYLHLRKELPDLPCLPLKKVMYIPDEIRDFPKLLAKVLPNLEEIILLTAGRSDERFRRDLQIIADASSCLKKLRLVQIRHICPGEPPKGFFSSIGKSVKILEIDGCMLGAVDLKDVGEILLEFPTLEELRLNFIKGLSCSSAGPSKNHIFPNVTSLAISTNKVQEGTPNYMFQMFPQLQKVMFMGPESKTNTQVYNFKILPALRIVQLSNLNGVDIAELLELPRATQDGSRFEISTSIQSLSDNDINSLMCCGWNFFPKSEYSFEKVLW